MGVAIGQKVPQQRQKLGTTTTTAAAGTVAGQVESGSQASRSIDSRLSVEE